MDALDCAFLLAARGEFEFLGINSFEIPPALLEPDPHRIGIPALG